MILTHPFARIFHRVSARKQFPRRVFARANGEEQHAQVHPELLVPMTERFPCPSQVSKVLYRRVQFGKAIFSSIQSTVLKRILMPAQARSYSTLGDRRHQSPVRLLTQTENECRIPWLPDKEISIVPQIKSKRVRVQVKHITVKRGCSERRIGTTVSSHKEI